MNYSTLPSIIKTLRDFPKGAGVAISDTSRFVYYEPGENIDLAIKTGENLREGTVSLKTLQDKRMVATLVDEKVFGVPYFGTGYPIINNGKVEAVVTAILPPEEKKVKWSAQKNFLVGKKEDLWIPIQLKDIIYISSEESKTFIHTKSGKYQNKFSLTELEYRLPSDQFIRCHRSYIIQMNGITEIQPNFHSTFLLIMKDDKNERIPVSQSYSSNFRTWLGF